MAVKIRTFCACVRCRAGPASPVRSSLAVGVVHRPAVAWVHRSRPGIGSASASAVRQGGAWKGPAKYWVSSSAASVPDNGSGPVRAVDADVHAARYFAGVISSVAELMAAYSPPIPVLAMNRRWRGQRRARPPRRCGPRPARCPPRYLIAECAAVLDRLGEWMASARPPRCARSAGRITMRTPGSALRQPGRRFSAAPVSAEPAGRASARRHVR